MKKNLLIYLSLAAAAILLISGTLYSSSSPGKKSGSPMDGATCLSCHTGSTVEVKDKWISSNIPATGWVPKTTYTITIAAEDAIAAKIGFELTAENATSKVGTFKITETTSTTLTNGNKAVTHRDAGNIPTDGIVKWTVDWTAPDVDSGDITFFAAFNAANGNKSTNGDRIFTSTYTVAQDQTTTGIEVPDLIENAVYPNPAYGFVFVQSEKQLRSISIIDIQGKLVKTIKNPSENRSIIDLTGIRNGNYLIKAVTSDGEFVKKIQLIN